MRYVKILLGVCSLLAVLAIALWESESFTSPGQLHPSHAHVASLQGATGCAACHGDHSQGMASACFQCHDLVGKQLANGTGVHGSLGDAVMADCHTCHVEHTAGAIALVSDRSFIAAKITDHDAYDHRHVTSFVLAGRHETLECKACHRNIHREVLRKGERRYMGLNTGCSTCHSDPHVGAYGNDCASCHGQTHAFDKVAEFSHDPGFPLTGGHEKKSCQSCHEKESAHGIPALLAAAVGADVPKPAPRRCIDCHETPHRESFIRKSATLARVSVKDTCALCHDADHETFVGSRVSMTPKLHGASGFELRKPHEKVACGACHAAFNKRKALAEGPRFAERFQKLFPGRLESDCASCHTDPHKGQFKKSSSKGRCIDCHERTHFTPSSFSVSQHNKSVFPLTGSHLAVACSKCHQVAKGVRQFVTTPTTCASCHDDVHRGKFDASGKPKVVRGATGCARCHETSSFTKVTWTAADHALWTGWALKGSHAKASCVDCHKPGSLVGRAKSVPTRKPKSKP